MRRLGILLGFLAAALAWSASAFAQNTTGLVVSACGTVPNAFKTGNPGPFTIDNNGSMCINGTISASITFPTIGTAVPSTGIYNGLNVGGTLRGETGLALGSTFSQTVAIVDGSGNQVTSFGGANASVSATGSAVPASATYVGITSGGNLTGWNGAVSQSGTWNITNISGTLSLPTGAATSANQATEISSLATIATNTGAAIPAGTANIGNVGQISQYPTGATPYTASATGTTAATTATLTGASSVTTYLCGFSIRANATAAATGNTTVTGTITTTLNFTQWTAPNASGLGITEMIFTPCVPASAANTSIAVISAAPGTGGVVSVTAWGYKL